MKELTSLMLDVLAKNKPEEGPLQTRLLEINLKHAPRVADAIFQNKIFTHYDKSKIATLAEQVQSYLRGVCGFWLFLSAF